MKNIIVLGDSFCSSADQWPTMLANAVSRNLVCYTNGSGQSWWDARNWLTQLDANILDNTDIMVFVHTNSDRIPSSNRSLGLVDHSATPVTEIEQSISLYYKYIHDPKFLNWAQQQWFKEIAQMYAANRVVHLHSFPWSVHLLEFGVNVVTPLAALSLNELGKTNFDLFNDTRANHFNAANNQALATELSHLINNYCPGSAVLDHNKFEQRVLQWLDWK